MLPFELCHNLRWSVLAATLRHLLRPFGALLCRVPSLLEPQVSPRHNDHPSRGWQAPRICPTKSHLKSWPHQLRDPKGRFDPRFNISHDKARASNNTQQDRTKGTSTPSTPRRHTTNLSHRRRETTEVLGFSLFRQLCAVCVFDKPFLGSVPFLTHASLARSLGRFPSTDWLHFELLGPRPHPAEMAAPGASAPSWVFFKTVMSSIAPVFFARQRSAQKCQGFSPRDSPWATRSE